MKIENRKAGFYTKFLKNVGCSEESIKDYLKLCNSMFEVFDDLFLKLEEISKLRHDSHLKKKQVLGIYGIKEEELRKLTYENIETAALFQILLDNGKMTSGTQMIFKGEKLCNASIAYWIIRVYKQYIHYTK